MAGTIKGITVEIGGETVDLKKSIDDVVKKSKDLQKELKDVDKQLKFDPSNTVLLAQKQELLEEKIGATKEELKRLKSVQDQVEDQAKNGDISAEKYRKYQREIETTKGVLKNYEKQLDECKTAQEETATSANNTDLSKYKKEVDGVKDSAEKLRDTLKNTATDIGVGLGAAGTAALGAVKSYDSAKSALNSLQAQAGLTADEMIKYEDILEDIYKNNFGESQEEIANVLGLIKQTTNETDANKLKEMTENLFTLSDTFGYDFTETLRAVNMLMEQFGITGEEAFNLIAQGSQKGLNKNGDLLDTVNEYAVHYKQLGYNAEQFFNSLENGSKAGTFSIDKLGDAMKEFGIRTKDTATSTQEGFSLLGYGAAASAEDISKAKDEVKKLEKNLYYAKEEQKNFNSSTSELTKQKNADKIAEYSDSLEAAKEKLQNLESAGKGTKGSIEDLQARFSAGGESARSATDEVLQALFEMDDKVKQNQAGVDLFGTMWEDLGIDGVKALMDVQGEADKTTDSMNQIKDIKYDDVENDISTLGRTVQTDIIIPLVEDAYPDIKNGIEWVSKNLDKVIPIIQGIAREVGIAWSAKKTNDIVNGVIDLYKSYRTLKTATDAAKVSQTALNAAQNTNAIGLIITAVATLGNVLYTLYDANKNAEDSTDELKEKQEKAKEKVDELKKSYTDFVDTKNEKLSDNTSEFQYYYDLNEELGKIVDKNGKVLEGYEDRAEFIVGVMKEKTGLEIEYNDGVIKSYQNLKTEIENYLKTKEAEAALSAIESSYTESTQKRKQATIDAATAYNDLLDKQEKLEKRKNDLSEAQNIDINNKDEVTAWYRKAYGLTKNQSVDFFTARTGLFGYLANIQTDIKNLESEVDNAKETYINLSNTVSEYSRTITYYEDLAAAVASKDTDKISEALDTLNNNFITAGNGTEDELRNQKDKLGKNLSELREALKSGADGVNQDMVDNAEKLYNDACNEYDKFIKNNGKLSAKVEKQASDNANTAAEKHAKILRENAKSLREQYKNGVPGVGILQVTAAEEAADLAEKELKKVEGITDKHNKSQKEKTKKAVSDVNNEAGKINVSGAVKNDMSSAVDNMNVKGDELSGTMTIVTGNTRNAAKVGGWSWIGSTWIGSIIDGIFGRNEDVENAGEGAANQAKSGAGKVSLFAKGFNLISSFINGIFGRNEDAANAGEESANQAKSGAGKVSAFDDGNNFVQGFVNGIKNGNAFELIVSAAESVASTAWNALRKFLGIASPSKLTIEDGGYFSEGFSIGINKKSKLAIESAQNLAKNTHKALQTTNFNINDAAKNVENMIGVSKNSINNNSTSVNKNLIVSPKINVEIKQTPSSKSIDGRALGQQISKEITHTLIQNEMKWGKL